MDIFFLLVDADFSFLDAAVLLFDMACLFLDAASFLLDVALSLWDAASFLLDVALLISDVAVYLLWICCLFASLLLVCQPRQCSSRCVVLSMVDAASEPSTVKFVDIVSVALPFGCCFPVFCCFRGVHGQGGIQCKQNCALRFTDRIEGLSAV